MAAIAPTALNHEKFKQYCSLSCNDFGEKRNYDYGFRDYSPVAMRFTTVDPIKDGINWYAYVSNDPINKIDPYGLDELIANYNRDNNLVVNYVGTYGDELTGQVSTFNMYSSNNVRTPEQRNGQPVYDSTADALIFPGTFPESSEDGWNLLHSNDPNRNWPGVSQHPNDMIGPFVETDAERQTMSYIEVDDELVEAGMVTERGFYVHGGDFQGISTGLNNPDSTTLGCLRQNNCTPSQLQNLVDAAINSGGDARVYVPAESCND